MKYRIKRKLPIEDFNIRHGDIISLEPITEPNELLEDTICDWLIKEGLDAPDERIERLSKLLQQNGLITEPTEPKEVDWKKVAEKTQEFFNKQTTEPYIIKTSAKPKEQSLEEKMETTVQTLLYHNSWDCKDNESIYNMELKHLAQIAKEHFQENPEEIDCVPAVGARTMARTIEGMVSLDKVLEVFDENTIGKSFNINFGASSTRIMSAVQEMIVNLRKALENLRSEHE